MLIPIIAVSVVVFFFIAMGMRTVHPWQRGIIERMGRYTRTVDSGLTIIIPFLDTMRIIDMREQVVDVPPQGVITKDNVVVEVDAVVYYEVTDPVKMTYNVSSFYLAITKLAQTNLRNLVGDMDLDTSLTSRETINTKLKKILDDATDKWGTRVTRVELQRIEPPHDVTEAMHRQMKAERERRATILEAEGQKTSAILKAEGEAEAIKKVADADKYQKLTVAAGEAEAIETVYRAIHKGNPTKDLITIKYLEALAKISEGKSNKVFIPYEASGILSSLGVIKELFAEEKPELITTAPKGRE